MKGIMVRAQVKTITVETGEMWSVDDLIRLWKAPGRTESGKRQWTLRQIRDLGLRNCGTPKAPRYLPAKVVAAMNNRAGGGR